MTATPLLLSRFLPANPERDRHLHVMRQLLQQLEGVADAAQDVLDLPAAGWPRAPIDDHDGASWTRTQEAARAVAWVAEQALDVLRAACPVDAAELERMFEGVDVAD
jgi:hypothetical protein